MKAIDLKYIGYPINENEPLSNQKEKQMQKISDLYFKESLLYTLITPLKMKNLNAEQINNQDFEDDFDGNDISFFKLYESIQRRVGLPQLSENTKEDWKNNGIPVFSVLEGSFGENFNNSLGDSFLSNMQNMTSDKFRDYLQITGSNNQFESGKNLQDQLSDVSGDGILGKIFGGAEDIFGSLSNLSNSISKTDSKNTLLNSLNNSVEIQVKGNKLDFPKVWKDSGMSQSYSVRTRLYCSDPKNDESFLKNIAVPLTLLLLLAVPRSDQQLSYKWPFYIKLLIPGNISLISMIENISVVKGGDSMAFQTNQRPYIVDVSFSISSLYNTLLQPTNNVSSVGSSMLSIDNYLNAMLSAKIMDNNGDISILRWSGNPQTDPRLSISPYEVITKKTPTRF